MSSTNFFLNIYLQSFYLKQFKKTIYEQVNAGKSARPGNFVHPRVRFLVIDNGFFSAQIGASVADLSN